MLALTKTTDDKDAIRVIVAEGGGGGGGTGGLTNTELRATPVPTQDQRIPTNGQKTMTGSIPVVIASNQSAVPVDVKSLGLPTTSSTGLYLVLGGATDENVAIPAGATSVVLWFSATNAVDAANVIGRIVFTGSNSVVNVTTTSHGYQPAMPTQYTLPTTGITHIHFAGATGNTIRGFYTFGV